MSPKIGSGPSDPGAGPFIEGITGATAPSGNVEQLKKTKVGLSGRKNWLGEEDSNLHWRIQSPQSCRWTIPQNDKGLLSFFTGESPGMQPFCLPAGGLAFIEAAGTRRFDLEL